MRIIAHLEKYSQKKSYGIIRHAKRAYKSNHTKSSIDVTKTKYNYNLASKDQPNPENTFLKKRLSELKYRKRIDSVVLCSWIVTLSKEAIEDEELFFKYVYEFLSNSYGKQNIVSAYVHKDETTPHIHFLFIPNLNGTDRLSAKELITREHLRSFHGKLEKFVEEKLGYPVGITNNVIKERGKHYKTVDQLKKENTKLEIKNTSLINQVSLNINRIHDTEIENNKLISEYEQIKNNTLYSNEKKVKDLEYRIENLNNLLNNLLSLLKEILDHLFDLDLIDSFNLFNESLNEILSNDISSKENERDNL